MGTFLLIATGWTITY